MMVKAYAKVNLYLDITGRLDNGYHSIETVMHAIDLADDICVDISESDESSITVSCDNPDIPTDGRNIAYKAAAKFIDELRPEKQYSVDIAIKKRIPVSGGLGGSSTDGAAVLVALNNYFGRPFTLKKLCEMGGELSADLAFCITGGTCACTGTGGITTPIKPLNCAFVIVKPEFSLDTAAGYALYDCCPIARKDDFGRFITAMNGENVDFALMYNVFEKLYNDSRIDNIKRVLTENGADGALMTGSGSAVFGVFANGFEKAEKAAEIIAKKSDLTVFCAKSIIM